MTNVRYFVPKGGRPVDARLQCLCFSKGIWLDAPMIYEDPDDEVVKCPRLREVNKGHLRPGGALLCQICGGTGWVRKGDLEEK